MDFTIAPEAQRLVDTAAGFEDRLISEARDREAAGTIGADLTREMGRAGLIAPELDRDLGGGGLTKVTAGLITEAVARGDLTVAYLQVVGSLLGQLIARNAAPEVAAHYCGLITSGEGTVAIGLSEPGAGSDAGNPSVTARRDGDDWIVSGRDRHLRPHGPGGGPREGDLRVPHRPGLARRDPHRDHRHGAGGRGPRAR
jgi:cyclohexanecarboxyl-CoA dehydrogenase